MKKNKPGDPFPNDDWFPSDDWQPRLPNGGASWAAWNPPSKPEPVYIAKDEWPSPKERTDQVFAKSCLSKNWCSTDAGTTTEPASHFGNVMVAGAMLLPDASTAIALALGADAGLGRMAGGGIMQQRMTWALRGAGGPASVFILGMLPTKMGDGTLHTDDQLRSMSRATTRVRFQFRRDAEGVLQVYGIHTGASGDDSVRTVQVKWNAAKTVLEAELNGITILWTPQNGRLGHMPPLVYPDDSGAQLGTILVHPIAENTDSQLEGLPGEDITTDDCILVFPADSGLTSLYVVFTKPVGGGDIKYHRPPLGLPAFPDAFPVKSKSSVQGGGAKRSRWKDRKGRIYEWDSKTAAIELYGKQGNHLGEFNHETGEQIDPAKPGRTTPK
ncbi:S-type pyocin domain-containing protein [Pseudomonas sp. CCC3.1]|uniref:S-type pyocin domain-containing protein n=1 Tax=Pseudomonas sp. CCC3.1 TaxID=3048607 RepID=UPI002AC8D5AD|nr:S-type pyocin domain-containing protein [Pseudomonas sp. CCC3.1]MEB0205731.1 S-type pyocin domain-containing protein [Pseudomonas sp. CCC3.1]WPX35913.1 S-type pyocin domain-containing protein [Pseudomonas sp. CCC3.1]